jgi:hypothetical protein
LKVKYFNFLKNIIIVMGCCFGCDNDDHGGGEVLAEYNPLLLGDPVDETNNYIYTQRIIECAERLIQPRSVEMSRNLSQQQLPTSPENREYLE